ncbi:peptide deformylase [Iocasia frigidifontis]|uniref:Peptide deformylase n=2 Tax=Halanaerobiales TaxID=53433 RepID=A0A8A7KM97_9FIRM|nr:peptide deformylase [Halocella sp. SP3-1]QTL99967.1 peptide deformylase [Iocasia fonsfrigidae]
MLILLKCYNKILEVNYMAILPIRKVGDPVLRSKARKVKEVTEKTRELIENMAETMYDAPGSGLAAPQVGILQQIITIDADDGRGLIALINPEILTVSDEKIIMEEACLSVPGEKGDVIRPRRVTVKGLNKDNEEIVIEADKYLARVLQHEIDHLNGILFIDKLGNSLR